MKHFKSGNNPEIPYDKPIIPGVHIEDEYNAIAEYESHCGGLHYEPEPEDWYEGMKHFED